MRNENNQIITGTIYDNVFRTECEYMKPLLIPVINELFDTSYELKADVMRLANEHVRSEDAKDQDDPAEDSSKRITDSLLRLGDRLYHVECQATNDGRILLRLVDYDMRIGYEHAKYDGRKKRIRVEFPMSALLMLKKGEVGREKISYIPAIPDKDQQDSKR